MKKALVCLAALFILWLLFRNPKAATIEYVRSHNVELEQFAIGLIEGLTESDEPLYKLDEHEPVYNGWDVTCYADKGIVEFDVMSRGIAPASTYEGFYYSADDKLRGFQGEEVYFVEADGGWLHKGAGDNREYVEKIMDKWYWYKASF